MSELKGERGPMGLIGPKGDRGLPGKDGTNVSIICIDNLKE